MVSVTSPRTPRALPMTGVISALPVNHRLGGSLEDLILKISSRVNDRRCLWGKLLSSMIRYHLNVTIVSGFHLSENILARYRIQNFLLALPMQYVSLAENPEGH